jgi:mevalonate kinase
VKQIFSAHGKLMLTGEYVVLDGALSLALPTQKGQRLEVISIPENEFHWKSFDVEGKIWLEGIWDVTLQEWKSISDKDAAKYLEVLLKYANNELGIDLSGFAANTFLEFPNHWGLGTSSTFISLIAQWWRVDPYYLLKITFGGSGYDIACANSNQPIIYQLQNQQPIVEKVAFRPIFREVLAFVYLGNKQNSRDGISKYRSIQTDKSEVISELNDITRKVLACDDLDEFEHLIGVHEYLISDLIRIERVKDRLFPEYWGSVKSLGAWGGDFVMINHHGDEEEAKAYFKHLGYTTYIPYSDMVLEF